MGHYDEIIEKAEAEEYAARAESMGLTVDQLWRLEQHEEKMLEGQKIDERLSRERELRDYYLRYKGLDSKELVKSRRLPR